MKLIKTPGQITQIHLKYLTTNKLRRIKTISQCVTSVLVVNKKKAASKKNQTLVLLMVITKVPKLNIHLNTSQQSMKQNLTMMHNKILSNSI